MLCFQPPFYVSFCPRLLFRHEMIYEEMISVIYDMSAMREVRWRYRHIFHTPILKRHLRHTARVWLKRRAAEAARCYMSAIECGIIYIHLPRYITGCFSRLYGFTVCSPPPIRKMLATRERAISLRCLRMYRRAMEAMPIL